MKKKKRRRFWRDKTEREAEESRSSSRTLRVALGIALGVTLAFALGIAVGYVLGIAAEKERAAKGRNPQYIIQAEIDRLNKSRRSGPGH